jgi:tetratricopeptide (TPR) repeat protein
MKKTSFLDRFRLSPRGQRRLQKIGASAIAVVSYPFRLLFGLARMIAQVIASWWESRNLRYLLQGLPAFAVSIGLVVVAAMIFFQDRSALATEYKTSGEKYLYDAQRRAQANLENKVPLALSQTYFKRLNRLQQGDETSFQMAQTYAVQRQMRAAEGIFRSLAPSPDKTGYGPAHYEVARRLLARMHGPQDLVPVIQHLSRAVAFNKDPWTSLANELLFEIKRGQNRPEEAEQHLVAAVQSMGNTQPKFRTELAQWYLTNGKMDLAERQIDAAIVTYDRRFHDNPDDHETRLSLINCLRLAGTLKCARSDFKRGKDDFDRGQILAKQGIELTARTPVARMYMEYLKLVMLAQYNVAVNDPNYTAAQRFAIIENVAIMFPNDALVLQQLITYFRMAGPEGEKTRKMFQDIIDTNSKSSFLAHLFIGMDDWKHDDVTSARYHWERAFELSDGAPLIANNLAWILAMRPPVDLDRALALIEAALAKESRPEYHGTRGHILAKMKKWREALQELEQAKPAIKDDPVQGADLFRALSDCYSGLGMESDARHAKEKADALKVQAEKGQRPSPGTGSSGPAGPLTNAPKDPARPQNSTSDPKP